MDGEGNAYLMLQKGKWNIFGNIAYKNYYDSNFQRDSTSYSDNSYLIENSNSFSRENIAYGLFNINYEISKKQSLNLNVLGHFVHKNSRVNDRIGTMMTNKTGYDRIPFFSTNIEYERKFEKEWTLKTSYGFSGIFDNKSYNYQIQTNTEKHDVNYIPKTRGLLHNVNIDATKKYDKFALITGMSAEFGRLSDKYEYRGELPTWMSMLNQFKGNENIYAAYVNGNYKFDSRFSMDFGLRMEVTDYRINNIIDDSFAHKTYVDCFPSLSMTHKAKNVIQTIFVEYLIERPKYWNLIPGNRYISEYSYVSGNPHLKSRRTAILQYKGTFFQYAILSLRGEYDWDLSKQILQLQDGNITSYTHENYADRSGFDVYCQIPFALFKRRLYGAITPTYMISWLHNPRNGFEIPFKKKFYDEFSVNGFIEYDICKVISIGVSGSYTAKSRWDQMLVNPKWSVDSEISIYPLKNKKMCIGLIFNDIFNSSHSDIIYHYTGTERHYYSKSITRYLEFSLRWNFGGGKEVEAKRMASANDTSRMQ